MQDKTRILIVDDEKNIRLTVGRALEPLGYETDTAVNGEEALQILDEDNPYALVLLDLRMPGISGMDVLQHIAEHYPETHVVIISAHGTVENAVEAMKLGAVDFIQKPFTPQEIRDIVSGVLERGELSEREHAMLDYASRLELARHYASTRQLERAMEHVRSAIGMDPSRPEAFNVLGVLHELRGDRVEANKYYRAAIDLDPTYQPAHTNLSRSTQSPRSPEPPVFE